MPDKAKIEAEKPEFDKLRDEASEHFLKAVDCLAKAYLTPYIQDQLDKKKKLDKKDIIKKVDIASRIIYPKVLKSYFMVEDGDGKSSKTIEIKSDEKPSRECK